jgi:hypothetical protein
VGLKNNGKRIVEQTKVGKQKKGHRQFFKGSMAAYNRKPSHFVLPTMLMFGVIGGIYYSTLSLTTPKQDWQDFSTAVKESFSDDTRYKQSIDPISLNSPKNRPSNLSDKDYKVYVANIKANNNGLVPVATHDKAVGWYESVYDLRFAVPPETVTAKAEYDKLKARIAKNNKAIEKAKSSKKDSEKIAKLTSENNVLSEKVKELEGQIFIPQVYKNADNRTVKLKLVKRPTDKKKLKVLVAKNKVYNGGYLNVNQPKKIGTENVALTENTSSKSLMWVEDNRENRVLSSFKFDVPEGVHGVPYCNEGGTVNNMTITIRKYNIDLYPRRLDVRKSNE